MADISVALELDDSQYLSRIANADKAASKFGKSLTDAGTAGSAAMSKLSAGAEAVKSKMESLGSAVIGVGLGAFLMSSIEGASQMAELANSIGVTTEAMMEMQLAGQASGKSADDLANMIQKMSVAAQDASDGNLKLRDDFSKLGMSMDDLRKMSPDEAFNKLAHSLASIEEPARRAQLAGELMGKAAKMTDWGDVASNLDKYRGSQEEAAKATEAAKEIMDNLGVKVQEVKNQFVLLLQPILEWINPFIQGTNGAKEAALGLAVVMGTFAAAGTLVAINSVKDAVIGLAGAFGFGSAGARAESVALAENSIATQQNAATKLEGLAAKVASYEASIAEARATVGAASATSGETIADGELAAAKNLLTTTTWRLTVAKAGLAEATAASTGASRLATGAIAAEGVASTGAAVATTGFAGAMGTLRTAVVTTLGPIGAFVAAAGSLYAVWQATFGAEHGIFSSTGDQSGANFISDFVGITDSTAGDLDAQTKKMSDDMVKQQKLMIDKMNEQSKNATGGVSVLNPNSGDLNPNAAAAQGIKNQTAMMLKNNQLAADRLRLEFELVGATDQARAAKLAQNDSDAKTATEVLRIEGEITRLRIDQANSRESTKNATQIIELEKQKQLLIDQNVEMGKLKGQLVEAQNAQKLTTYYMEDQLKVTKEIADLKIATDELTMTNDEKKLSNINKQINAQIEGAVKLKELQLGRKLSEDELTPIRANITKDWEPVKQATQDLIDKSRTFETGWTQAWKSYADEATNAANRGKEVFSIMTGAAESAFDKLIGDSNATWKQIFDDAIKQMMKSDFKNAMGQLLQSSNGGSSGGGFFQGLGKFFAGGFANGGKIPAGGYGITGEQGPEYVNGPATITPMQSGGTTNNFYITAMDSQDVKRALAPHSELIYGLTVKGQRAVGG